MRVMIFRLFALPLGLCLQMFSVSLVHAQPDFVGSEACIACHKDQAEAWRGSHHDLAWTEPSADTILGDFANTEFTHQGVTSKFSKDGDSFIIETEGPDGEMTKFPVKAVLGVAPLQQYAVETEPGRLQSFDIPWDVPQQEWFHMYPDQNLPAGDGYHWTGPYKTWNARCAECHATDYQRNYDAATRQYSSTQSEIGVGCEACHGPGTSHVDWANDVPIRERVDGLSDKGLMVDYAAGDVETEIQQCASCHARREPLLGGSPVAGTPFHDAYRLSTLRAPLYEPDGQILDEVYVYGSFLQSKMYDRGVTCSNCHDVHAANRVAEGNAVCTQCHSPAANPDFTTLKAVDYDTPEHHFHAQDSEGAQCKNCHMIERTYMGVDGRRDHSFRVPRPDLTVKTGALNACNDCHTDQSPQWAARQLDKQFPNSKYRGTHFSETFHAVQQGTPDQGRALADIALYEGLPAIVRASALEMILPYATPELATDLQGLLTHEDALIRAHAVAVQRSASSTTMVQNLVPMLDDARRAVRIAAARELLSAPIARLPSAMDKALKSAMAEWQSSLLVKADFPETQLVLAGIGLTTRNYASARSAFAEAVELDPQLVQAWVMMVRIDAALAGPEKVRETLQAALELNPSDPNLRALQAQLDAN